MSGSAGHDAKAEPNLTPILDMVFQLITFFMLVINFKAAELDLSLQLPVLTSAKPLPPEAAKDIKLLVLNVQICTKCPVPGCDAMATLHRVVDEDSKKVLGYRLVCEHGHGNGANDPVHPVSDYPLGSIPNGKTCLSIYGRLYCKEARDNTPSIEDYLKTESESSLKSAGLTRDQVVKEGKELKDIVVIRADTTCRFGAVNYIITKCQEQGYRTFSLKTSHTDRH